MRDSFFSTSVDERAYGSGAAIGAPRLSLCADRRRVNEFPFRASPNADERPDPADVSLLVVHSISLPPGQFGARQRGERCIDALFLNTLDCDAHPYFDALRALHVSAHVCIYRDGSATQFVDFDRRAWHAGESWFDGRTRCNDFAIGVELEGDDDTPYEDAQYRTLARLARVLIDAYPKLTAERILGHADIAPSRKTDPGRYFDWTRFRFELEYPR